jgi:hypothetical protein
MSSFTGSWITEQAVILDLKIKEITDKMATQQELNNNLLGREKSYLESIPKQISGSLDKNNFSKISSMINDKNDTDFNKKNSIKVQCWIRPSDNKKTDFFIMSLKKIEDISKARTSSIAISHNQRIFNNNRDTQNPMFVYRNSKSSLNTEKQSNSLKEQKTRDELTFIEEENRKIKTESSEFIETDENSYASVIYFIKARIMKFKTSRSLKFSLILASILISLSFASIFVEFSFKISYFNAVNKQKEMVYNFAILKKSVSVLCSTNFLQSNSTLEMLWSKSPTYYKHIVR